METRVFDTEVECGGDAFAPPSFRSLIGVRAALSPYLIAKWICWSFCWFWRFTIKKEEYGEEERVYLTAKALGVSRAVLLGWDEAQREDFVSKELWIKENMIAFQKQR